MELSVVIPVYNSEQMLRALVARLHPVLEQIATEYELILVNDGSRDNSWAVISELSKEYDWILGINLMRNYGQHNALLCGIRMGKYKTTVTMDDDLQHPPEEIGKLLEKLDEGYMVAYGKPREAQHNNSRKLASRFHRMVLKKVMKNDTAGDATAFRAFNTKIRESFTAYCGPSVSIDVLLSWGTSSFTLVEVEHSQRLAGVSNYTFAKLLSHAFDMITGFSVWPLQMASMIGFSFTIFGFCILIYVLSCYLVLGYSIPGFPFLASIIAIFSGAQLFAMGIIGEYLARVHLRSTGFPSYAISETTDATEKQGGK